MNRGRGGPGEEHVAPTSVLKISLRNNYATINIHVYKLQRSYTCISSGGSFCPCLELFAKMGSC